jgi:signal transduction histidine kinase
MNNLLHNAIKFTEQGRVTLELLATGSNTIIRTTDTGIGISKDDQSRLFQFFAEGRDMAARTQTGSGLGLAFSQEMVRLHGGTITVDSAPGGGTTVTVSLPLV